MVIKIGCCGWAVKGGMSKYFETFDLIELQSTFYKLPTIETAKRWREMAPETFIYTMKAWQAVTHPPTSPTWRKSGLKITKDKYPKYGFLKPTNENYEAWDRTVEIAEALKCRVIVLQMPPSFIKSQESLSNIKEFMSTAKRPKNIEIGIEFRHESWDDQTIGKICEDLGLIHVVDPFKQKLARDTSNIIYYRLHGLGSKPYVYDYSLEELKKLYEEFVKPYADTKEVYVLFNNTNMANDALDFKKVILAT